MNRIFVRTVQSIYTEKFTLKMLRSAGNMFVIKTQAAASVNSHYSESIKNYETASILFDLKLKELNEIYK